MSVKISNPEAVAEIGFTVVLALALVVVPVFTVIASL
jgi:hypothetical protein